MDLGPGFAVIFVLYILLLKILIGGFSDMPNLPWRKGKMKKKKRGH